MPALALPALHASHGGTWLRDGSGETRGIGKGEAIVAAADTPLLLLNAPLVASRLGYPDLSGLDLLELFAFVHPARFVVPTPKGLAHALGLERPLDVEVKLGLGQPGNQRVAGCRVHRLATLAQSAPGVNYRPSVSTSLDTNGGLVSKKSPFVSSGGRRP